MKVALTGSTGFLGVHLIHHLIKNGHQVIAIKREASSLEEFDLVCSFYKEDPSFYHKLQWLDIELYDTASLAEAFQSCQAVVHSAGLISYSLKDRQALRYVNQELTESVVNAALSTSVEHFVLISSTGALQNRNEHGFITEELNWDSGLDHTYYGYTKYLGEKEVYRASEEGLSFSILNPGIILGYGDWTKGSLKLFKNAFRSFPFYSKGVTGFIGVEDLCRITIERLSKGPNGKRICCIGSNHSFKEIAELMARSFDVKGPRIEVKGWLYQLILALMKVKDHLKLGGMLSAESTRSSIAQKPYDNKALMESIDFTLQPIEYVINSTCVAYKKNSPPR